MPSYNDVLTHLDKMEEDILEAKSEVEKRQAVMKEEFLANIKDARQLIVFINEKAAKTKDKEILKEFDELKEKLEEVITSNEQALKEYC